MSSRALRRAQRELEEKQLVEQAEADDSGEENADPEEEDATPARIPKASLFAMLGNAEGGEDAGTADSAEENGSKKEIVERAAPAPSRNKVKNKKKKKKGKAANKTAGAASLDKSAIEGDEIDRALLALKLSDRSRKDGAQDDSSAVNEETQTMCSALSVDTQYLHADNEMRKLFGRAALDHDDEPPNVRQRGAQQGGVARQLAGRHATDHRGLASLGLKRNIFVKGKEEWPRATSGGLGMEVVEKRADGIIEYRFVHTMNYRSVQQEFESCVASMNPESMVALLQRNPYHISTLLQVSEIAKQQRDNATAGELLERSLFSFGRAVHSTFSSHLSQGKARLDFRRPENREFWLAVWRYIGVLSVRATWRTAYEWAKLLVSLSPEEDPYFMRLLVDQLALRGREPAQLIHIAESDCLQRQWKIPPNLAYSVTLAHDRLKQPAEARKALRLAIKEYPWLAARLCKELDISPIPKPIWGKETNNDLQELLCQMYVTRAKDLWNTTEATSLLVEVCYTLDGEVGSSEEPYWLADFNEIDLARHVILTDDPALVNLLDPRIKSQFASVSDPLPPPNSFASYTSPTSAQDADLARATLLSELEQLRQYFDDVDIGRYINADSNPTPEDVMRMLEQAGTTLDRFRRNTQRVQQLRTQLQALGVEVVFDAAAREQETASDTDD